jgi:hypothetical protein
MISGFSIGSILGNLLSPKLPSWTGIFGGGEELTDAIISPNGNLLSTHPDDYLIATKTPETLGKGQGEMIINVTYNISGVSSPSDVKKMLDENNTEQAVWQEELKGKFKQLMSVVMGSN